MEKKPQLDSAQNHNKVLSQEMLAYLKDAWCWLALGAVAGVVLFVMTLSVMYEARAIVQVGNVLSSDKDFISEQTAIVLERVNISSFYSNNKTPACNTPSELLLGGHVKGVPIRGGLLVQLTYQAETPERASACIVELVRHLVEIQSVEVSKSKRELLLPLGLVAPVAVYEKWVYPKMLFSLASFLLGGFVFGGLLFLVRLRWLKR